MTDAEILNRICDDLPGLDCRPGCVDCCSVALWSLEEWRRLPAEYKGQGKGLLKVPMRINGGRTVTAFLPVKAKDMMSLAVRKKLAVTVAAEESIVLAGFGLENIACPYRQEGVGCTIYDYRPFVCRIMGASAVEGPMHCPHGIDCVAPVPETVIMQRYLLWTNLFENDPRLMEK